MDMESDSIEFKEPDMEEGFVFNQWTGFGIIFERSGSEFGFERHQRTGYRFGFESNHRTRYVVRLFRDRWTRCGIENNLLESDYKEIKELYIEWSSIETN